MHLRRLFALVLLVAVGVLASVCWFVAAENAVQAQDEKQPATQAAPEGNSPIAEVDASESRPWSLVRTPRSSPRGT